jgi:protein TonB
MREIFKAYSLSFLIHSLLLFSFFLLTQRLILPEKRLIEIDLSLENVQRQPSADLPQKAQPLSARPPQTQPVPQATVSPLKEEIKSSAVEKIKQEESLIQATSPPKPTEAEIREVQTSQVQTAPQPKEEIKSTTAKQLKQEEKQSQVQSPPKPAEAEIREVQIPQVQTLPLSKEETKGQTAEHPGQGERLFQAKEISPKPASQEREGKNLQAQTNKSVESPSKPTSSLTDESRKVSLEEGFLRERLLVITDIVQRHINYPPIARRMGWEGKVLVSFVLEPNGDIRDLKVLKSCGYEVLDKEALDAIRRSYKDFPKPPVSVVVKLPINFRLE